MVRDIGGECERGHVIVCGVNSGLYSPLAADCHAEANAVAESAAFGWSLLDATCYVSKTPCRNCFSLLAVAGVARIVMPNAYPGSRGKQDMSQDWVARELGMECTVVRCTEERISRRERLARETRDWERIRGVREQKKMEPEERARYNLQMFSEDA